MKKLFVLLLLIIGIFFPCLAYADGEEQLEGKDESGECRYYLLEDGTACLTYYSINDHDAVSFTFPDSISDSRTGEVFSVSRLDDSFYTYFASGVKTLTIPDTLSVGKNVNVFRDFNWMTEFIVSESHPTLKAADGVLFDKEGETLICYPGGKKDEEYVIPDGVTTLSGRAFHWNSYLKQVTIPSSVIHVSENPFTGNHLASLMIAKENPALTFIEGVLYDKTDRRLVSFLGSYKRLEIPEGITRIEDYAFYYISGGLQEVSIPSTVREIGISAFESSDLVQAEFAEGLRSIGKEAFKACRNLSELILPDSLEEIGELAFSHSGICRLAFPAGLETIENQVASGCKNLSELTLPERLVKIEYSAFDSCSSLSEVSLPDSLESIGNGAFSFTALKKLEIPENVGYIGRFAFDYNPDLEEVLFSGPVETLKLGVFSNDSALSTVKLAEGLKEIESGVFSDCPALTELMIPASVLEIDENAFGENVPHLIVSAGSAAENLCLQYEWEYSLNPEEEDPFAWLHDEAVTEEEAPFDWLHDETVIEEEDPFARLYDEVITEKDDLDIQETEPAVIETEPEAAETEPIVIETEPEAVEAEPEAAETEPEAAQTDPRDVLCGIALSMADQIAMNVSRDYLSLYSADPEVTAQARDFGQGLLRQNLCSARYITFDLHMDPDAGAYAAELAGSSLSLYAVRENNAYGAVVLAAASILRIQDSYPLPNGVDRDSAVLLAYKNNIFLMVSFHVSEHGTMTADAVPYRSTSGFFSEELSGDELPDNLELSDTLDGIPAAITYQMEKTAAGCAVSPEEMQTEGGDKISADYSSLSAAAEDLALRIGEKADSEEYADILSLPEEIRRLIPSFRAMKGRPAGGIIVFPGEGLKDVLKSMIQEQTDDQAALGMMDDEYLLQRLMASIPSVLTGQLFGADWIAATSQLTAGDTWLCEEQYSGVYWLIYGVSGDYRICSVTFRTNSHGVLTASAAVMPGSGVMSDIVDAVAGKGDFSSLGDSEDNSFSGFLLRWLKQGEYHQP